jgi:hypothetical protein
MSEWTSEITNNPDDDYNLMIEILNDDEYVGRIYKENSKLVLQIYETEKKISIPYNWLLKIMISAEKELSK